MNLVISKQTQSTHLSTTGWHWSFCYSPLLTAFTLPEPPSGQSSTLSVALAKSPPPPSQVSKAAASRTAQKTRRRTRLCERTCEDLLFHCQDLLKCVELRGSSTQPFREALPNVIILRFMLSGHLSQEDGHSSAPPGEEGTPKCSWVACQVLRWE